MVAPNVNYLFLPFLFLFLLFSVNHLFKDNNLQYVISIIKYNILLLIICLLVIWGNIISSEIIFFSIKEALNSLIIFFLANNFFMLIKTSESFERFTSIFGDQIILLSILIAIIGILKYIIQLMGIGFPEAVFSNQVGTSLSSDYNFYVLFSFLGIIYLLFFRSKIGRIKFYSFLSILFINVVFSGSRRGLIFLFIFCALFFLFGTNFRFEIKKVTFRFAVLIGVVVLLLFSYYRLTNEKSIIKKNQSTDLLKTSEAQNVLTKIGYRYFTIINKRKSLYDFFLDIWDRNNKVENTSVKKQYPEMDGDNLIYNGNFKLGLMYWYPMADKVVHEIIQTPYGNGVRVTRYNGDNSGWPLQYIGRDILFYAGHTYTISFKFKIDKGDNIPFKIGLKVDDPILGGKASGLYPDIKNLENGWKQGICSHTFWRSISDIPLFMNSQEHDTEIEFADIKVQDINSIDSLPKFGDQVSYVRNEVQNYLKRYDSIYYAKNQNSEEKTNLFYNGDFTMGTLFWLPAASATEHSLVETPYGKGIKVTRKDGDEAYWSLLYNGRPIIYWAGHTYRLSFLFRVLKGSGKPFNVGWQADDGFRNFPSFYLPCEITRLEDGWNEAVLFDKFKNTHYDLPTFLNSMKDNTEIEIAKVRLVDVDNKGNLPRFVDELHAKEVKTHDIPVKSASITNIQPGFYGSRIDRWKYSVELFINNYTLKQKIFGNGFDYLKLFVKKFGDGKIDYPHNPFLDAFLFSGIIGGLIYILYVTLVIFYYFKFYKKHKVFFYCFSIVFIFSIVSANTHFSVPVFAILCIIPFLSKYLNENELQEKASSETNMDKW
jgi:hypothetical protein